MTRKMLHIRETFTIEQWLDVEDLYSGMTPEEAKQHELDRELGDRIESFVEILPNAIFDIEAMPTSERSPYETIGAGSLSIEIVEYRLEDFKSPEQMVKETAEKAGFEYRREPIYDDRATD